MPANRKRPGTRVDTRPQRRQDVHLEVVEPGRELEVPAAPSGLLVASKQRWQQYWTSRMAGQVVDVDMTVVERWIFAYDEWKRALTAVRKARLVAGSQGQPVANPLMGWAQSREKEMHSCEAELGIGPKSRSNLGITIGQEAMTAQRLNEMAEEVTDAGQEGAIEATSREEADLLSGFEEAR